MTFWKPISNGKPEINVTYLNMFTTFPSCFKDAFQKEVQAFFTNECKS